jgi:hypothetical protein
MGVILAAGCGRPSLATHIEGAWALQTVNGRAVPEWVRDGVTVVFLADGTCQRGDEVGTFDVVDDATIRTRIGDRTEVVSVKISGDTLTMRPAGGAVTALKRVRFQASSP